MLTHPSLRSKIAHYRVLAVTHGKVKRTAYVPLPFKVSRLLTACCRAYSQGSAWWVRGCRILPFLLGPSYNLGFCYNGGKKEIVMEKQLVISAMAMTFGSVAVTGNLGLLLGRKTEGNI